MRIIEKIEIKYFRSFDGGVGQPKVEIIDLKDLNIFSGANDSGKSNILRALNLFFNNEVSPGVSFDLQRDLSKIQKQRSDNKINAKRKDGEKGVRQKDLWVKIRIFFFKETEGVLPQRFYVEKTWDKNSLIPARNSNIRSKSDPKKDRAQEGQLTQFLNNIRFEYVPAVKDRQFFNYLFKKLQDFLFEKQDRKRINGFEKHSSDFNKLLKNETRKLFDDFRNNTNIEARFHIPETLVDFFRTLGVETNNGVSLFDRGDGIQARFIPDILNEISRETKKKTIWGFEEPENSYEPLKCFELSQDFLKYSTGKQIFVTSHAFPFITLKGKNVSSYRIKNTHSTSKVGKIDWEKRSVGEPTALDDMNELEKEIGLLETYNKLNEHLGKQNLKQKSYVFVEDQKLQIYKIAWLKLNGISFDKNNFNQIFQLESAFNFYGKNGRKELAKHLDAVGIEEYQNQKVVGIFDFDDAFQDFNGLHKSRWDPIQGEKGSSLFRKRKNNYSFSAMLIPVPTTRENYAKGTQHHYLTLEHLFEDKVLKSMGVLAKPKNPSGDLEISEIRGKSSFWEKIIPLPKDEFSNFKPLFQRIDNLIA